MTLIEQVQAVLAPLASGGSWYAVNTSSPPEYPYITFQRIVSKVNNTMAGPSDLQNTVFQIDAWAERISEASAIATAIAEAMQAASFTAIQIMRHDLWEKDVKAHRCIADYSCWAIESSSIRSPAAGSITITGIPPTVI